MSRYILAALCIFPTQAGAGELAVKLRNFDAEVFPADQKDEVRSALSKYLRARRDAANVRSTFAWRKVHSKLDWEKFRAPRIEALRRSLGRWITRNCAKHDRVEVTGSIEKDSFIVENLILRNPKCVPITANLYRPTDLKEHAPGILISHSHHNPKTQGELQDMGMMWARLGCLVLVMDQLGHGERRQHPFVDKSSFDKPFRVGRQDYYFRYNVGMQLHLAGESLIGWMVRDLDRGRRLLIDKGAAPQKIVLLGAVAGGGDPAAVAGAISDGDYAAVVPFNFGGPEPENRFPLPKDADLSFNFAGSGSWESTRNLQYSCRDGFLPWVIVGAIAPKGLIYAHEFAWDKQHDPVWKRLKKIYAFYDASDRLSSLHGRGSVRGRPPTSTHCNNIGPVHRKQMYATLKDWVGIPIPTKEYSDRLPSTALLCVTPKTAKLKTARSFAGQLVDQIHEKLRNELAKKGKKSLRATLRKRWRDALGSMDDTRRRAKLVAREKVDGVTVEKYLLIDRSGEDQVSEPPIPVLLLLPDEADAARVPVVVAVAQEGKQGFLQHRSEYIAKLLQQGVAVCLPDLRGTGEARIPGDSRRRRSYSTGISSTALMVGDPLVAQRLRDLRSVLAFSRNHPKIDEVGLWGDSFAKTNSPESPLEMPLRIDGLPSQSEPIGGLLVLLASLYETDVRAVYVRGGVADLRSVLDSAFCYLPHDVVVPGALTAGDLPLMAAAMSPIPLRLEGLVNAASNVKLEGKRLQKIYHESMQTYSHDRHARHLTLAEAPAAAQAITRWFAEHLKRSQ